MSNPSIEYSTHSIWLKVKNGCLKHMVALSTHLRIMIAGFMTSPQPFNYCVLIPGFKMLCMSKQSKTDVECGLTELFSWNIPFQSSFHSTQSYIIKQQQQISPGTKTIFSLRKPWRFFVNHILRLSVYVSFPGPLWSPIVCKFPVTNPRISLLYHNVSVQ